MVEKEYPFTIKIVQSFRDVPGEAWDALLPGHGLAHPFLRYDFLSALEESGSATAQTGWLGQHILVFDGENPENGPLIGAVPCYLKSHSQGEYVFDHAWAHAFERAGGQYYPKLQSSIPFTPAMANKLLIAPGQYQTLLSDLLLTALAQRCKSLNLSSAHMTFVDPETLPELSRNDFLIRTDQQFHWHNDTYQNFAEFLDSLSSRKRKNIRKERQAANAIEAVEIEKLTGSAINENHWDHFFEFYTDTGNRKWGQPYLSREFFSLIGHTMADQILLVMAKRNGQYIAGALNFIGPDALYGRHWGCTEYHSALHFEVCYYQAIEFAIEHGIPRVEAGAQGEHKLSRGYLPAMTYSGHWIENESFRNAVNDYLTAERRHVDHDAVVLNSHSPFKQIDPDINGS